MRYLATPRSFLAALLMAVAGLAASVGLAAPASAMSPCYGDNPPDWCFSPPAAPGAPTSFRAPSVLQTSVTLTWDSLGTRPITLTRTVGSTTTTLHPATGSTTFTDTVPAGTSIGYALFVTACNTYGCTDGAAASMTVTTHPFGANPIGSAYGSTITWYGAPTNPDDRAYYEMHGSALDFDTTSAISVQLVSDGQPLGSPIAASGASNTNAANPGYGDNHGFSASWLRKASGKGNHTTCAVALNVAGGVDTQIGCFTYYVPGPPAAATNVRAVAGATSVAVSFTDNANDESSWYVQRTTDGGANWLQIGGVNAALSGTGSTGRLTDYSTVGSGVCYRVVEQNGYGSTVSAPGCTG